MVGQPWLGTKHVTKARPVSLATHTNDKCDQADGDRDADYPPRPEKTQRSSAAFYRRVTRYGGARPPRAARAASRNTRQRTAAPAASLEISSALRSWANAALACCAAGMAHQPDSETKFRPFLLQGHAQGLARDGRCVCMGVRVATPFALTAQCPSRLRRRR